MFVLRILLSWLLYNVIDYIRNECNRNHAIFKVIVIDNLRPSSRNRPNPDLRSVNCMQKLLKMLNFDVQRQGLYSLMLK